jgi:phosphonoacetaldehyde hydrolase
MTTNTYTRRYRGPVKAVVFDLAGTIIDFGSCAPAGAFVELFRRNNVHITLSQAREPMGLHKKDHIRTLLSMSDISEKWLEAHGKAWSEADVEAKYREFIPIQIECLADYGHLIPGTLETEKALRSMGIKIGVTTGYNEEMMKIVLNCAKGQGFSPDAAVCASRVSKGRPAPWMIFRIMEHLNIFPPEAVINIGDTLPDIEAGLNAGVWTIGVVKTGNMIGLPKRKLARLNPEILEARMKQAKEKMHRAGAHYVIDDISDAIRVLDLINHRLSLREIS